MGDLGRLLAGHAESCFPERVSAADPAQIVVVYVTAPEKDAATVARELVDRKVAACVNVLPAVRSFFHWEGTVQDEPESLLIVKSTRARFEALRAAVVEVHPYSVPEIIAVPVVEGHEPYTQWVEESLA